MGTESAQELLRRWRLEEITVEMATGYILQNLVKSDEEIANLTRALHKLRADVNRLAAQADVSPQKH